jgi:hypothetical protein
MPPRPDPEPVDSRNFLEVARDWYFRQPLVARNLLVWICFVFLFVAVGAVSARHFSQDPVNVLFVGRVYLPFTYLLGSQNPLSWLMNMFVAQWLFNPFERELGSIQAFWFTLMYGAVTAFLLDAILVLAMINFAPVSGIQHLFLFFISVRCFSDPHRETNQCGCLIKNLYFPFILAFLFIILNGALFGFMALTYGTMLLGGYLFIRGYLGFLMLPERAVAALEAARWFSWVTGRRNFIKKADSLAALFGPLVGRDHMAAAAHVAGASAAPAPAPGAGAGPAGQQRRTATAGGPVVMGRNAEAAAAAAATQQPTRPFQGSGHVLGRAGPGDVLMTAPMMSAPAISAPVPPAAHPAPHVVVNIPARLPSEQAAAPAPTPAPLLPPPSAARPANAASAAAAAAEARAKRQAEEEEQERRRRAAQGDDANEEISLI